MDCTVCMGRNVENAPPHTDLKKGSWVPVDLVWVSIWYWSTILDGSKQPHRILFLESYKVRMKPEEQVHLNETVFCILDCGGTLHSFYLPSETKRPACPTADLPRAHSGWWHLHVCSLQPLRLRSIHSCSNNFKSQTIPNSSYFKAIRYQGGQLKNRNSIYCIGRRWSFEEWESRMAGKPASHLLEWGWYNHQDTPGPPFRLSCVLPRGWGSRKAEWDSEESDLCEHQRP